MKVSEDKTLNRDVLKGFYTFLHSESIRHQEDIDMIYERMDEIAERIDLTPTEQAMLREESLKYVHF